MVDCSKFAKKIPFFLAVFTFFFFWETELAILIGIEFLIPIILFTYCTIRHCKLMPKVVIATSLFSLSIDIGLTKYLLDSSRTLTILPLVMFLKNEVIHDNWIASISLIIGALALTRLLIKKSYHYAKEIYNKTNLEIISQVIDSLAFLYGCSVFVIHLTIANIIAGILFNIVQTDSTFFDVVKQLLPYVSINVFFFTVPLLIIALSCCIYVHNLKIKE